MQEKKEKKVKYQSCEHLDYFEKCTVASSVKSTL